MQAMENRNVYEPLVLTLQQRNVLDALKSNETEEWPLSEWYLGALYALDNPYNPDRVAQAAYWIVNLNETWATEHKSDFFPENALPEWIAAFESLVEYSKLSSATFKTLQEEFNFLLQHLSNFKNRDRFGVAPIDILGYHLFTYYLWDLYPLGGNGSLLERYYQQTNNDPERWVHLFCLIWTIN